MLLTTYISSLVVCVLISFTCFQGKEIQNGRKMHGSFLPVLGVAWAPDTLLKQFGGATEEEQEKSHRNEQKLLKEWV